MGGAVQAAMLGHFVLDSLKLKPPEEKADRAPRKLLNLMFDKAPLSFYFPTRK